MQPRAFHKGSALITCIIFLVVFMALAVGMATMSGANLRMSDNQRAANSAFASAESGLEVVRYWADQIRMPSSTAVEDYLSTAISDLQAELVANGIDNLHINTDGSIPTVVVHALAGQSFTGQFSVDPGNPAVLRVLIVGNSHQAARTIRANFRIKPYRFPIFDYGMATKGPLVLPGSAKFQAASQGWEADVYIESADSLIAVDIGKNATFAGDIDLGNPLASISGSDDLSLGGEIQKLGEEDRPVFPVPNVQQFRQYATGTVIDKDTDLSQPTYTNALIEAGTDPIFTAPNVNIRGILYIEAPNKVMFSKITSLDGMIVADGDVNNPGENQINFGDPDAPSVPSNFLSGPYPPGAEFDGLRNAVGSCILAPGFAVSFWKNFTSANGVIAASGLHFDKNANAKVEGTLIDYSPKSTVVDGNINMTFDRSALVEIPAGFDLFRVLTYDPGSYTIVF